MKIKGSKIIFLLTAALMTAGLVTTLAAASGSPVIVSASLSVTYEEDGEKELVLYPPVENSSLPLHFEVTGRGVLIDSAAVHLVYADNSIAVVAWDKQRGKEWNNRFDGTSVTWHWVLNNDGILVLSSSGN